MKLVNSKSIHRLLFANDHNNVSREEIIDHQTGVTVTIRPTPTVSKIVEQFRSSGFRMAFLIENNSKDLVKDLEFTFIPDELEFIHLPVVDRKAFALSCKGFATHPEEVLLIAADRNLRTAALDAGMSAVPHPAMVKSIIDDQPLFFGKLDGAKNLIQRLPDIVPYYVETYAHDACQLFGSLSPNTIAQAIQQNINVQIYQVDLARHDFMFVRIDNHRDQGLLSALANRMILSYERGRILVALDKDSQNDDISLHGDHGHYWYLMPSPELLEAGNTDFYAGGPALSAKQISLMHSIGKSQLIEWLETNSNLLDIGELLFPGCPMSACDYEKTVSRYSGKTTLDSGGIIRSREVRHPDNERVVNTLLRDLRAMGYCAWTHSFCVQGQIAKNVIAELPGRGYFRIHPTWLDKIRKILERHPSANPVTPWLSELEKILGQEWSAQLHGQANTPWQLRHLAEMQLGVYQYPALRCPVAGFGAELVIVGCHLDSTAASDGQFDPANDPAPGADDDASGIAGTLATAQFMTVYRNKLKHSVRFCFFNAEELGMVGSQAYAAYLKSINGNVKAVVCMDMIGFNSDANRLFEVHAGYTDPLIRDQSVPIANQIASSASQQGNLAATQIYQGTIASAGANRNTHDGAINRSDHSSFHHQGYPAVVVSEDFFINQFGEPPSDPNPNYHRSSDTVIDSSYGADIACAVAHAVKELAK